MIMTGEMMIETMQAVEYPRMKLSRDAKEGRIIRLKNNLYSTDRNISKMVLAPLLCGPSYISFDCALSFYGIIPETAYSITSATFRKHKDKEFHNENGSFYYSDVPASVYPIGVTYRCIDGFGVYIASREKALCDRLYKKPPCSNRKEFEDLIFDDMRVFDDVIPELDPVMISELARGYRCRNVNQLERMVKEIRE